MAINASILYVLTYTHLRHLPSGQARPLRGTCAEAVSEVAAARPRYLHVRRSRRARVRVRVRVRGRGRGRGRVRVGLGLEGSGSGQGQGKGQLGLGCLWQEARCAS